MIKFVGAGPGDPELVTIKGKKALEEAQVVLYTGSLIPKEVLSWCSNNALILNSANMDYDDIFNFFLEHHHQNMVRLHTGDPSIYSTIAKQIEFLKHKNIAYEVIAGVTAAFGAAASLGIEYTIPGVSQTLILSRIEGKTPNPENLKQLLSNKNSSFAFYLSINLIKKLKQTAYELNYKENTPCWVIEKATWAEEKIYKSTLNNIENKVKHIKGIALILFGNYLTQKELEKSHLYNKKYKEDRLKNGS
jgi:precorrin-4/cobalt-precorrin-4 C11-methyltransferase